MWPFKRKRTVDILKRLLSDAERDGRHDLARSLTSAVTVALRDEWEKVNGDRRANNRQSA